MNKIAITSTSFGEYDSEPLDILKNAGFEVKLNSYKRKLSDGEVVEFCKDAVGIVAGTENLGDAILRKLPYIKVISRCGTGLDNVDLDAAKRLGIKIFNTPDIPTWAVAELTVGLVLDLMRKISLMNKELHNGLWQKRMGNLLYQKKVGIIGFGRIGRKVCALLMAFGCEVSYFDIKKEKEITGVKRLELDELLGISDIVTIHVSSSSRLLDKDKINIMKKGAWLVNISRGGVVDENALYLALKRSHLAGAALDVFEQEPYKGSLAQLDNVVLTPHIGSYAKETRVKMEREAVENLIKGLKGKD